MVEAGHYAQLDNLIDVISSSAADDSDAATPQRQCFLFSATSGHPSRANLQHAAAKLAAVEAQRTAAPRLKPWQPRGGETPEEMEAAMARRKARAAERRLQQLQRKWQV